jgi:outer membrane protein assembly factor BamB
MMRRNLFIFSGLAMCGFQLCAADWPHWRGPNHNGISTETGWQAVWPPQGPKRLWKAEVGTGFASVSVSDGRVFTVGNASNQDTVYCFDAVSGEEVWRYSYRHGLDAKYYEGGPSATPTVEGQRVYLLSKRGDVHCLDANTGAVVWQRDLAEELEAKAPTWGFAGSALVKGGLVVLNVGDAGTALNKLTGDVVWSSGRGPGGYSTPVPLEHAGAPAMALMGAEALMAVGVNDGKKLWEFPWETAHDVNAADPVIDGDRYLISSGYGKGCALVQVKGTQPTLLWQNKNLRSHFATAVIWKGHAYGVDENEMVCLDLASGAVRWRERSLGKGSLMIADGKIIALSDKGELMVVETAPSAFKAISRAQVLGGKCWTVPVLANGRIYCRNAKGDLVCLDVRGR